MYYPPNAHNPSESQQFNQMNGSVQQITSHTTPYNSSAYGHQNYQNQQSGPAMRTTNSSYQKMPGTVPGANYPTPATHPQPQTQMTGRPDSRTHAVNSLSQQMTNMSMSNPQALQPSSGQSGVRGVHPPPINSSGMTAPPTGHFQQNAPVASLPPSVMGQSNANTSAQANWSQPNWQSGPQTNTPYHSSYSAHAMAPPMSDQSSNQMLSQPMPSRYPSTTPMGQMAPSMPPQMTAQVPAQPLSQMGTPAMPTGPPQPGFTQPGYSQQSQQRLDLEAMPSVVQVIDEDKAKYENNDNVLFTTSIPCSVPPLVTTFGEYENSITNDGGCARPQHIRSTIYQVPINEDTLKITNIPLAVVVQPFDDSEVDGKNVSDRHC